MFKKIRSTQKVKEQTSASSLLSIWRATGARVLSMCRILPACNCGTQTARYSCEESKTTKPPNCASNQQLTLDSRDMPANCALLFSSLLEHPGASGVAQRNMSAVSGVSRTRRTSHKELKGPRAPGHCTAPSSAGGKLRKCSRRRRCTSSRASRQPMASAFTGVSLGTPKRRQREKARP